VDNTFIITEEPDLADEFIGRIKQMATTGNIDGHKPGEEGPSIRGMRAANGEMLPFELRMLEVVLDEACRLLGVEVRGVVTSATARMSALQHSPVCFHLPCSPPSPSPPPPPYRPAHLQLPPGAGSAAGM
jgi:hypothetical protein